MEMPLFFALELELVTVEHSESCVCHPSNGSLFDPTDMFSLYHLSLYHRLSNLGQLHLEDRRAGLHPNPRIVGREATRLRLSLPLVFSNLPETHPNLVDANHCKSPVEK